MALRNCVQCGILFAQYKLTDTLCVECAVAEEHEFQQCREFMRNEPGKTVVEIAEGTGIALKRITGWIRDGRMTI